jgi:hypothetical protein
MTIHRQHTLALALCVSLMLHAGIGLLLVMVPGSRAEADGSAGLQVDACELGPNERAGNYLVEASEPEPMQAVLLAPPVVVEPALPNQGPMQGALQMTAPVEGSVGGSSSAPGERTGVPTARVGRGNGTRFFDVDAPGQTFVYVIDRSSSMGPGGGLRAAREELLRSLQQLPTSARFQIIVYNRNAEPLLPDHPGLLEATPDNIQRVAERLGRLLAEGGTDHLPALRRALALRPDVIFFLTDADDLTNDLLRTVARLNPGRRTIIHVIELNALNRDRMDMPMHVLARENGGSYRAVGLDR